MFKWLKRFLFGSTTSNTVVIKGQGNTVSINGIKQTNPLGNSLVIKDGIIIKDGVVVGGVSKKTVERKTPPVVARPLMPKPVIDRSIKDMLAREEEEKIRRQRRECQDSMDIANTLFIMDIVDNMTVTTTEPVGRIDYNSMREETVEPVVIDVPSTRVYTPSVDTSSSSSVSDSPDYSSKSYGCFSSSSSYSSSYDSGSSSCDSSSSSSASSWD